MIGRRGKIIGYRDAYTALVATSDHRRLLARSMLPLRTRKGPVDLTLQPSGSAFTPARSDTSLSIARQSSGGVTLRDGIRIILDGRESIGTQDQASGVFFPSVSTDMDAAVTPTASGVDLSTVLRSRRSPESLAYHVVLPAGTTLRAQGAGAAVYQGSKALLSIAPPTAIDAQGTSVPVTMTVAGDQLRLSAAHRDRDVAYPILVDPQVSYLTLYDTANWSFTNCTGDPRITGPRPGQVSIEAGTYDTAQECGEWVWTGQGRIFSADDDKSDALYGGGHGQGFMNWGTVGGQRSTSDTSPSCIDDIYGRYTDHFFSRNSNAPVCGTGFFLGFGKDVTGTLTGSGQTFTFPADTVTITRLIVYYDGPSVTVDPSQQAGSNNPAEPNTKRACAGHPVNCATGNFFESQTDLQARGRGPQLALTRTYNAQLGASGPMGFGWSSSFGDHLVFNNADQAVTVAQANGSTVPFSTASGTPSPTNPATQATLSQAADGTWTFTLPDKSTDRFDSGGALQSKSDRYGNALTFARDGSGRLSSITDGAGRSIGLHYESTGHVDRATGPMGSVSYSYDPGGNLIKVTALDGGIWQFGYDGAHRMTTETDPLGHVTTNVYDDADRVTSQTDGAGRTRTWRYPSATETVVTNPGGDVTDETFNAAGEPLSITRGSGSSSASTQSFYYDDALNPVQVTDGTGAATRYSYDAAGNQLSRIDANGQTTAWRYDADRNITSMTDALGRKTTYAYSNGELLSTSRPVTESSQTQTTAFDYNSSGDLTMVTDPLGNRTGLATTRPATARRPPRPVARRPPGPTTPAAT